MLALAISTRSTGEMLWNQNGSSHRQIVGQQGRHVFFKIYMCLSGSYHSSDQSATGYESFTPSSIKVEVKKKHSCIGPNFSCFAAHSIERDLF
jgi:hypothetical protein